MNQEERIQQLEEKLGRILAYYEQENFPSKVVMKRQLVLKDASNNTVFDSQDAAGFRLGVSGGKIGFYGATPVTRAAAISAPPTQGTTYNQSDVNLIVNAVNSIRSVLTNIGITS